MNDVTAKITLNSYAFKALALTMSKEEVRYYLNGVHFCQEGGKAFFVSTDGHRMLAYNMDHESDSPYDAIIPASLVTELGKLKGSLVTLTFTATEVKAEYDGVTRTESLIDGTYPQWKKLIPANVKEQVAAIYKAEYVGDLKKIATAIHAMYGKRLTKNSDNGYKIHQCGNDPAPVTFNCSENWLGVIMPMREVNKDEVVSLATVISSFETHTEVTMELAA